MATWSGTKAANLTQLATELGGNPTLKMKGNWGAGEAKLITTQSVTQVALDAALSAHVADFTGMGRRRPRNLRLIVADLDALSSQQKANVWNYVNGGSPVRWKLSNQGEVWNCLRLSESGALNAAQQTTMRIMAIALYVRNESPNFLVANAAVDATINVPGDEVEA